MVTIDEARTKILQEITSDDGDVRKDYLNHFESHVETFAIDMARAIVSWQSLHKNVNDNENLGIVSAWVITAISIHILSMKLLLSGHIVAAGNLFRQVVETIALALLCSATRDVLDRVTKGKYSTNKAIKDLLREADRIGIDREAVTVLRDAQLFYHNYSHPTLHTIWAGVSLSEAAPYVGSSFDDEKMDIYAKEIERRLDLASVFGNFVEVVKKNVAD